MRRLAAAVFGFLGVAAIFLSNENGAGRRFWYPTLIAVTGPRTHGDVRRWLGPKRRDALESAFSAVGLSYPPRRLTLVGLKDERRLEVWAENGRGWTRVRDYAVLAASGQAGPKLREGDLQVPEGEYRLTGFNPNSSYHLSIRVDYPSAEDRAIARGEGRTRLGGDIFIHGKAVSIGCLAIGDDAIEDLYLLLADTSLANARILLTPSAAPTAPAGAPPWLVERYGRLNRELSRVRGRAAAGTPHLPLPLTGSGLAPLQSNDPSSAGAS